MLHLHLSWYHAVMALWVSALPKYLIMALDNFQHALRAHLKVLLKGNWILWCINAPELSAVGFPTEPTSRSTNF